MWAGANGMHPKRARDFAAALEMNDFEKGRNMSNKYWKGLKLKSNM